MNPDDFPFQLEQLRREHYRKDPGQPMAYDDALIRRIVAYVVHRRRYLDTVAQCSERLGLAPSRVRQWVYQYRRHSDLDTHAPVADPPPLHTMLPVQVRARQVFVHDGVPQRLYSVLSPAGFQVHDLCLDELVTLLRQLQ